MRTYNCSIIILVLILTVKSELNCQTSLSLFNSNHNFATGKINDHYENLLNNPAFRNNSKSTYAGINISPSKYGLSELNYGSLFYERKFDRKVSSSITFQGMGGELYKEFSARLGTAYQFDDGLIIGAALEYARLNIKNNSSFDAVMLHIGSVINVSERITAGVAMHNVSRSAYEDIEENVDQVALVGLGVTTEDKIHFEVGGVVSLNEFSGFLFGIRHKILDLIDTKMSVGTNPRSLELGVGYEIPVGLDLMFSVYYDQELGYGKNIGLLYAD